MSENGKSPKDKNQVDNNLVNNITGQHKDYFCSSEYEESEDPDFQEVSESDLADSCVDNDENSDLDGVEKDPASCTVSEEEIEEPEEDLLNEINEMNEDIFLYNLEKNSGDQKISAKELVKSDNNISDYNTNSKLLRRKRKQDNQLKFNNV